MSHRASIFRKIFQFLFKTIINTKKAKRMEIYEKKSLIGDIVRRKIPVISFLLVIQCS